MAQLAAAGLAADRGAASRIPCPNEVYEARDGGGDGGRRKRAASRMSFSAICFCEDVRAYREEKLAGTGITPVFPLWERPTAALAREMIEAGVEALSRLRRSEAFAGALRRPPLRCSVARATAAGTDPCGENGEFHSFVAAGPMLTRRIPVTVGETVERDGFAYADLLPLEVAPSSVVPVARTQSCACLGFCERGRSPGMTQRCLRPRSTPPVRLPTSATILAASASISASVMVFSRGCMVTAMAIDFLPGSMPLPS